MTIAATTARLDALASRLDARRRAEAPGQLGLDLSGTAPPAAGGGGGEKCGESWIDPRKECHKGTGQAAAPVDPPNDTRRRRPVEPISFNPPLRGPSGADLLAYEWQWTMDSFQDSHGDEQLRRVSNWERAEQNAETGRQVVHQFKVRKLDGSTALVSSETAVRLLGYATADQKAGFKRLRSTAQTIARLEMEKAQLEQDRERVNQAFDEVEKRHPPEPRLVQNPWGLAWEMPDSKAEMLAEVMPRTEGGYRRRASTPEEAYLMPYERSRLVSEWQADRVGEQLGRRMRPRGAFNDTTDYEAAQLDKRIAKARKRLEEVAAAEAEKAAGSAPGRSDRIDSLLARVDAVRRRCTTGYSCGSACISVKKECRSRPAAATSRERIQRLEQLAKGQIKPQGIGTPKPAEALAMAGKLRGERAEQQAVIKAEQERRKAAAAKEGKRKPSVVVKLRRAKAGGEYGPDGHWYPGGAWMPEGGYVGAKPKGQGDLVAGGADGKGKPGSGEQRVVRPKDRPRRVQPTEPKGEGLPRPTGIKKTAQKNDQEFFNDRGYIRENLRYGDQSLSGYDFQAAVAQRMTTEELNWATDQIAKMTGRSRQQIEDDTELALDAERYGGTKEYLDYLRSFSRNELSGVDDDRLKAAIIFMEASRHLGGTSPAQQRLMARRKHYSDITNEGSRPPERKPRRQPADRKSRHDYGDWVWGLNNVFRAVRIRRGKA